MSSVVRPGTPGAAPAPLQRDLFDDSAPAVFSTPSVTAAPAPAAPVVAPPPVPRAFVHPQADREITLHGHRVAYLLRRARRSSIGFVVGTDGLVVSAPRWIGVGEIAAALQEKAGWIVRKLHEQHERARRIEAARIEWRDGTTIPFLGEPVVVVLDGRVAGAQLDAGEDPVRQPQGALAGVARRVLRVGLPHDAAPAQIRDLVQSWLQRQARRIFEERVRHFATPLGVRWKRLALSSAQTRWGSASADGSIRLNWRLVHFALPTIDYVVAHELAHLRVMDHSPRFWDVVRSVLPDYEDVRGRLKDDVLPVFE
jgi:predicted metal-dependent hydrolase